MAAVPFLYFVLNFKMVNALLGVVPLIQGPSISVEMEMSVPGLVVNEMMVEIFFVKPFFTPLFCSRC